MAKAGNKKEDKSVEDEESGGPSPAQQMTFKRKSNVKKGEGLWLMSFSDMSLILMSFFILQLAFSSPDRRKYDNLSSAISKSENKKEDNLQAISEKVRRVIKAKNLEEVAEVTYDVNGLAVEFRDKSLFAAGSAAHNPRTAPVVNEIMKVLATAPADYKLVFEGHTDDMPISGKKFSSNWELSAARGIALLNDFKGRGVAEARMAVRAFAQTKPKVPLSGLKGNALSNARAANRRVVIRLE
jgi:chemotaxis protein MotB